METWRKSGHVIVAIIIHWNNVNNYVEEATRMNSDNKKEVIDDIDGWALHCFYRTFSASIDRWWLVVTLDGVVFHWKWCHNDITKQRYYHFSHRADNDTFETICAKICVYACVYHCTLHTWDVAKEVQLRRLTLHLLLLCYFPLASLRIRFCKWYNSH